MSINPSLALIPCAYDTGKLYSVLPEDGTGDFTVSRNGNASYFDKDGILRTALPNEPRLDFDPLTGEFKGVLVEPAATNLVTNNNNIYIATASSYTSKTLIENFIGIFSAIRLNHSSGSFISQGFQIGESDDIRLFNQLVVSFIIDSPTSDFFGINYWGTLNVSRFKFSTLEKSEPNDFIYKLGVNRYLIILNKIISPSFAQFSQFRIANINSFTSTNPGVVQGSFTIFLPTSVPFLNNPNFPFTNFSFIPTTGSQVTRPADQITVTVPMGATQCVYILNGTQVTVPVTGGSTFTLPNGHITQLYMI